jgi:uncharacterized membrane protein YhaH (DUF805 family)
MRRRWAFEPMEYVARLAKQVWAARRASAGGLLPPSGVDQGRPTVQLPSLSLISQQVREDMAAQERRGDGLDTKAGIVLGFAGVVVGVTIDKLEGAITTVGTALTALAALLAVVAFVPRSFPSLAVRRLRDSYLTTDEDVTRLRLLDTQIAMYQRTERLLTLKGRLVTLAAVVLGVAVLLIVVGSTLERGGIRNESGCCRGGGRSVVARAARV